MCLEKIRHQNESLLVPYVPVHWFTPLRTKPELGCVKIPFKVAGNELPNRERIKTTQSWQEQVLFSVSVVFLPNRHFKFFS